MEITLAEAAVNTLFCDHFVKKKKRMQSYFAENYIHCQQGSERKAMYCKRGS